MAITKIIADSITSGAVANTPNFLVKSPDTGQTLSTGTWTKLVGWTNVYDTASGFDFTNDKYTIPTGQGGKYHVYARIKNADSTTRRIQVAIYINGSLASNSRTAAATTTYYSGVQISYVVNLSASDYLEVYGRIDNGGGGSVMTSTNEELFGAYKIIE